MLSHLFLGMSLLGAEWVLILLILISILSVGLIVERIFFYRAVTRGLTEFRSQVRSYAARGNWGEALRSAESRAKGQESGPSDLESKLTLALLTHAKGSGKNSVEVLDELSRDAVVRARLGWEKNLSVLATIGSNAPFVGLFGTVLGIIKAFHDLSQQGGAGVGAQGVTAGISEALVATAVGILVAIPAVVAFNLFQRKVKSAVAEAEALKSYLIGKLAE